MDHERRSRDAYGRSARHYVDAVGTSISSAFEARFDVGILDTFVDAAGDGVVLDAGCGTGRVARFVADRGRSVVGVDVAPGMVDAAAKAHPDLRFVVGSLAQLPLTDGSVVAAIYWYSIITTPPLLLGDVWTETARVLAGSGRALVAFQAGDGTGVLRPDAYGTGVDLTLYRHDPDEVAEGLDRSGFDVVDVALRGPEFAHETTPQAFVTVRLP